MRVLQNQLKEVSFFTSCINIKKTFNVFLNTVQFIIIGTVSNTYRCNTWPRPHGFHYTFNISASRNNKLCL
ncbi:hypothetical protein Henu6_gp131 [Acinetobacter phage Henu6]|uniref:Uncharacterized protein n=1 Tax=Acinetobacter phage Henu6 TaxID=2500136 RepID=A0A410T5N7_9CAUD|nr:hypothetical protein Henu6_gp131 [Acinetobacter phage Henu6]